MDNFVTNTALHLVVFAVEGQRYALPLHTVERVFPMAKVAPLPKAPAIVRGVINLHGTIIPVMDIHRRFGFPPRDYGPVAHLLVARTSRRTLALPVDEVFGAREVMAEAALPADVRMPGIGHLSGIVALADGLLFIQDLETFLSLEEEQRLSEALGTEG